ncbi:MMPL family transporter [Streptomyces sp. NPDC002722]|uniref:MMPL family transporter n=1 Tax=unclassified Streptomyces TaxID=2593676 RepID=UPI00332151BC
MLALLLAVTAIAVLVVGGMPRLSLGGYTLPASGQSAGHTPDLIVLATVREGTVTAHQEAGRALTARLAAGPGVLIAWSAWTTGDPALRSKDGRSAQILAVLAGDETEAGNTAHRIAEQLADAPGPFTLRTTGRAYANYQAAALGERDLLKVEMVAAPLVVLMLLLAFGSPLAALLPVLIGGLSALWTLVLLWPLNQLLPVSVFAVNISTALGFGLAVDYALFMVTRYRTELRSGAPPETALATAVATAGRTALFSGAVVICCLSGLLVFPLPFLRSLALAAILVVALASLATRLLLPGLLRTLTPWIDRFDPLARWRRPKAEGRLWRRLAQAATDRPWTALLGSVTLLLAMAAPLAHLSFALMDDRVLPAIAASHQTSDIIRRDFAVPPDRRLVMLMPTADPTTAARWAQTADRLPGVQNSSTVPGAVVIDLADDGQSKAAADTVHALQALPAPHPHMLDGLPARLTGTQSALAEKVPTSILIVAGSALILLFWHTRALLLPLKALLLGALSLGAGLGAVVWVFQDGHAAGLLGDFTVTGHLDPTTPLLMFTVAFALCVDYEIFLLADIKEQRAAGLAPDATVINAVARTGRLITTAACVFACSVASLIISDIMLFKLLGFGLTLAVLIDATLVRAVMLPAFMRLAGRANWWAPTLTRTPQRATVPAQSPRPASHAEGPAPTHEVEPGDATGAPGDGDACPERDRSALHPGP